MPVSSLGKSDTDQEPRLAILFGSFDTRYRLRHRHIVYSLGVGVVAHFQLELRLMLNDTLNKREPLGIHK